MFVTLHGPRARKKMRDAGDGFSGGPPLPLRRPRDLGYRPRPDRGAHDDGAGIDAGSADGGLSWSTIVTAILVALLAGGVIGNLFASKRRRAPRFSVYDAIERRIDSEHDPSPDG
jgi:hypothetical protein